MLRQIGHTAMAGTAARVLTVAIPWLVARTFGFDAHTDALFLAAAVILYWTNTSAPVIETTVVREGTARSPAESWRDAARVGARFSAMGLGLGAAAYALLAAMPGWILAPEVGDAMRRFLLLFAPLIVLGVWSSVINGRLHLAGRFALPAAAPGLLGLSVIASVLVLGPHLGLEAVVLGYVAGESLRLGTLWWTASRSEATHRADAPPAIGGVSAQWVALAVFATVPLVSRSLAAALPAGSVTLLEQIERICLLPGLALGWAAAPVVVARWSTLRGSPAALRSHARRTLAIAVSLAAGGAVLLAAVHEPLLDALYATPVSAWPERGDRAFLLMLPAMPAYVAALGLWRLQAVYALPARVPLACAALSVLLAVGVGIALRQPLGLGGIALSVSIAVTGFALALYAAVDRALASDAVHAG